MASKPSPVSVPLRLDLNYDLSMIEDPTVPLSSSSIGVRRLRLEVIDGPNAGTVVEASDSISIGSGEGNGLVLEDETVSRFHAEVRREGSRVAVVDLGSTNGTLIGGAWVHRAWVAPGTTLRVGRSQLRLVDGESVDTELEPRDQLAGIIGSSSVIRQMMSKVRRAASSEASVIILGETGTGKEVVARALHDLGPRASAPFETVDCGSVIPTLIASELFGHERGAFTGADRQHIGAFERADGGTIFLDEVGELPAALQVALLGALERRSFRRLGGKEKVEVDVRVIAATHRDLRSEVNVGSFRADLYFRLAVVQINVPPLRERLEDLPLLVEHFLRLAAYEGPVSDLIDEAAMETLRAHRWPGNVRELRNVIQSTVAMGEAPLMDGPPPVPALNTPSAAEAGHGTSMQLDTVLGVPYPDARAAVIDQFEAIFVKALLERFGGNVSKAAREGHMNRSYLNKLMKRHGIKASRE